MLEKQAEKVDTQAEELRLLKTVVDTLLQSSHQRHQDLHQQAAGQRYDPFHTMFVDIVDRA